MKLVSALSFLKEPYRNAFGARIRLLERLLGLKGYGPSRIDLKVREIIGRKQGFYVEIGANDGISQSNTLVLEVYDDWRGVLIEGVPDIFLKLDRNRSSRRNVKVNTACVGFDFERPTLRMVEANLMTVPLLEETDIEDPHGHARLGRLSQTGYEGRLEPEIIEVDAMTMNDVLREARAPNVINFLSLDVEGGEIEVLKGIDFEEFSFDWMLIENRSLNRLENFLRGRGYSLHSQVSPHDFLFQNRAG